MSPTAQRPPVAGSGRALRRSHLLLRPGLLLLPALVLAPVRAEVIEDIVAWVDGEIITLSEFQDEEGNQVAEAYRRLSGAELDRWLEESRPAILLDMIDRKILVHHAKALGYDIDKLGESVFKSFKQQQGIDSDEEFKQMLETEGLTTETVKRRLVEMYAPQEVVEFEVRKRVTIPESEVEAYYASNPDLFRKAGEVTFREIVLRADSPAARSERRAEAEAIRRRAAEGEDFAELARAVSEAGTRAEGGLLGPLGAKDLSPELAEPAFGLPVGEVSEVLEVPHGFHIIKVESRVDDRVVSLDEVRGRLREHLEKREYQKRLAEFMATMRDRSDWCVKPAYGHLLSIPMPEECEKH